jgi:hypothetical protein
MGRNSGHPFDSAQLGMEHCKGCLTIMVKHKNGFARE